MDPRPAASWIMGAPRLKNRMYSESQVATSALTSPRALAAFAGASDGLRAAMVLVQRRKDRAS